MAAKHRKSRRRHSPAKRGWVPSLAAAAVTATSLTTALTTGTTVTVAPAVELTALITPANSTAQIFAGSDYYNYNWTPYGDPQVVPFFLGPQGIAAAIRSNADDDPNTQSIVVLSSGWGAGQTSTALDLIKNDPARKDIKLVVLDNNTNRAGGGFWTTYWMFAPLLLTSSEPTPSNIDVPVLDVGYDYNINGNAPTYPVNLLSDVNSLVAYAYGYGGEATAPVPAALINNPPAAGAQHYHYILDEQGNEIDKIPVSGNITYVTFKSDHLPLVKPLLLIPGGKLVADGIEPVLTVLVDAGYKDNQPIPNDPSVPRPMGLIPVKESITALQRLPGAVVEGVHNVQHDLSSPGEIFTTPNQPNQPSTSATTVNTLARKPQTPSLASTPKPGTPVSSFAIQDDSKPVADTNKPRTSSANNKPGQQVIGSVKSALDGLANSFGIGAKKPPDTNKPSDTGAPAAAPAGSSAGQSN